jgi:fimbrial isopeptide formation D2 family protein/LPXTG-motif cell wall-anchored protein
MHTMKKLISLVLALCLVLASCAVAFAADTPSYDATVTVNKIKAGNTLKLYKVAAASVGDDNAIHYTMTDGLPAAYDTIEEIQAVDGTAIKTMANAYGAFFGGKVADYSIPAGEGDIATGSVAPGYYFAIVSGTADTGVIYQSMLINAVPVVEGNGYKAAAPTADAKKEPTTVVKTEYDPATKQYAKTTDGYSRGDSIPFKIDTAIPSYPADSKYATFIIKDTPTGLKDTVSTVKVYVDGTKIDQDDEKFKVAAAGDGFTVTFTKTYILANAGKSVKVEYDAVLTAPAVGSGDTSNTATIEYNPNPFEDTTVVPPDTTEQHTYGLVFEKVDDKNAPLANAVFALYDEAGENAITQNGTALTFTTEVEDGHAYVWWDGLEAGTYTIKETAAPAGYVPCADFTMTVSSTVSTKDNPATKDKTETNFTDDKIQAENKPGASLPSTGGIGTTIFYILGGLLIVGAAIILVARRKAQD